MDDAQGLWAFILERQGELWQRTVEHLWLTGISVFLAVLIGLSLGIFLSRRPRFSRPVLGFANLVQTIPSIALLGFMIPLVGIGALPAIIALFLYALLPIIRNTYTGISDVDPAIKEAGIGMGMTDWQILRKVELPLALSVIFAGIRTATVINVGVATLCALIAAGGLGEFIFTGIALNNTNMILAGAIPAAILAVALDALLGQVQKNALRWVKPILILLALGILLYIGKALLYSEPQSKLLAGLEPEFMERRDGWPGLKEAYQLDMGAVQMNAGLMYSAVKNKEVDVIGGYSTDGRIDAFDLVVLEDDLHYFPPYYVAPLVHPQTLKEHPELLEVLNLLAGEISDPEMRLLNYKVDEEKQSPKEVARKFLEENGFPTGRDNEGGEQIAIGGKNFTEQFILGEMFSYLIENHTDLSVELKMGLGGTQISFEALRAKELDLYPEYTGTGFLVILEPSEETVDAIIRDSEAVYNFVKEEFKSRYDLEWLAPLGLNNTYALMMRREQAEALGVKTISDLAKYLQQ